MDMTFWKLALERAVKTAIQSIVLAIGAAQGANLFVLDWQNVAGAALAGFAISILTSLASVKIGPSDSPSLISEPKTPASPAVPEIGKPIP